MATLILTVPHSGTHFIVYYLAGILGLDGSRGYDRGKKHFCQVHPHELPDLSGFDSCLFTLRHPYDSASTHKTMLGRRWKPEDFSGFWDSFIETIKKFDKRLFVEIDGPKESRVSQMMAVAEFFDRADAPGIEKYVSEWEPRNATRRQKLELTKGERSELHRAVEAYEWLLNT